MSDALDQLADEIEQAVKEAPDAPQHASVDVEKLRPILADLRREQEKHTAELLAISLAIQRYQPVGSPPPGGLARLAAWICGTLAARAEQAEAKLSAHEAAIQRLREVFQIFLDAPIGDYEKTSEAVLDAVRALLTASPTPPQEPADD